MTLTGIGEKNISAFAPLMSGFSLDDVSIAVGAIHDDKAVGVVLLDAVDEALMLDYIYVVPEYRRKGIATDMLWGVIYEISSAEPAALHVNYPESSEALHGFFLSMGFKLYRDGRSYRIPAADILDTPAFKKVTSAKVKHRISRLSDMTNKEENDIKKAFEAARLKSNVIDNRSLSDELSLVAFDGETDEPEALVLCEEGDKIVSIVFLVSFKHDMVALADIIHALKDAILEKKGDDCDILFVTMDEKMEAFAKTLVGEEDDFVSTGPVISGILMLS